MSNAIMYFLPTWSELCAPDRISHYPMLPCFKLTRYYHHSSGLAWFGLIWSNLAYSWLALVYQFSCVAHEFPMLVVTLHAAHMVLHNHNDNEHQPNWGPRRTGSSIAKSALSRHAGGAYFGPQLKLETPFRITKNPVPRRHASSRSASSRHAGRTSFRSSPRLETPSREVYSPPRPFDCSARRCNGCFT